MKLRKHMRCCVSLPRNPGKVEFFTGEEVKKYLQKIFDEVTFEENPDAAEAVFVIGGPDRNQLAKQLVSELEFSRMVPGPEGFFYQIEGNTVLLAGSDETGTLYAAYEFLEQELGCCFGVFPLPQVPAGEVVPTCTEKELPDTVRYKAAADLAYRTAFVQYGAGGDANKVLTVPFIDYLAKNRYNRVLTWMSVYNQMKELGLLAEMEKRGIRITAGHHQSLKTFMPFEGNDLFPTAYGKKHPDFFRVLVDGRRQTAEGRLNWGQWYLCSRNEACIAEMAKNINWWLDQNPLVDTVTLWPNDGVYRQCQCGLCSKHTKMENYLYFCDAVAQLLKEANPERKVNVVVYLDLWDCPKGTKLSDNVRMLVASWTNKGLRRIGKPDGSGVLGNHICDTLHAYRDTGCQVALGEYYMGNYDNLQAVMPAADEMQSIDRYFKDHSFSGRGTQIECFNVWNNVLNFYAFGRNQYDTELSLERCIRDMSRLFGAGADAVAEILCIYENTLDGQVPINDTGKWFALHADAPTIYDLFEKALDQGEAPIYRNNIRLMRMAFRYTMLLQQNTEEAKEELGVLMSHFDSYKVNDPGFGIAFDVPYRTQKLPDDKWYRFEQ